MKQCSFCGSDAADEVRFCPNCGAAFPPCAAPDAACAGDPAPEQQNIPSACTSSESAPEQDTPVLGAEPEGIDTPGAMPPPQKRKHRIWPWVLGGIALLLAAGLLLYYFLCWSTPEQRIRRAAEKTRRAFIAQFEDCDNLNEFCEALEELSESDTLTTSFEISVKDDDFSIFLGASADTSNRGSVSGAYEFRAEAPDTPETIILDAEFSYEDGQFYFLLPALYDKAFSIDLNTVTEDLENSPIFADNEAMAQLAEFFQKNLRTPDTADEQAENLAKLCESLKYTELGNGIRTIGGKERTCTIYRVGYNKKYAERVFSTLSGTSVRSPSSSESFIDSFDEIRLVVDDRGYLVAVEVDLINLTEEMQTFVISLDGEKNPCSRVILGTASYPEEALAIESERAKDGLLIYFSTDGEDVFTIEYDDLSGQFLLHSEMEDLIFAFDTQEKRCSMSMEYDHDFYFSLKFELSPVKQPPRMIEAETLNPLLLSESDYAEILDEVRENIQGNPDYEWLLSELTPDDLTGDWCYELDLTDLLIQELRGELGSDLALDISFRLPCVLSFDEDCFELYISQDAFESALDALRTSLVAPITEYIYAACATEGIDRDTVDQIFADEYGYTVEEYIAELLEDADFNTDFSDLYQSGNYYTENDTLYLDGEEFFYTLDGNTLILIPSAADSYDDLPQWFPDYLEFQRVTNPQ